MTTRMCATCGERFQIARRIQRRCCRCAPGKTSGNRTRTGRVPLTGRKFQPQAGISRNSQSGLAASQRPNPYGSRGLSLQLRPRAASVPLPSRVGAVLPESESADPSRSSAPEESWQVGITRPRQIGTKVAKIDGKFYPVRVFESRPGIGNEIALRTSSALGTAHRRNGRHGSYVT